MRGNRATGALNTKVLIARSLSFMVSSGKVIWNKKSNALLPRQGKSEAVFLWWWLRNINLIIFVFVSESINVVSRGETRARNGVRQCWRINNQQQPILNEHWLPPRSCDCQSLKILLSSLSDSLAQLRMQWNSWPRDWTRPPRQWPPRRPSPRPRRPRTRARRCPTWPASRTRLLPASGGGVQLQEAPRQTGEIRNIQGEYKLQYRLARIIFSIFLRRKNQIFLAWRVCRI